MKAKLSTTLTVALISTTWGFAQSVYTPEDDIYYTPKTPNEIVEKKRAEQQQTTVTVTNPEKVEIRKTAPLSASTERDEDEYNRRYSGDQITELDIDTTKFYVEPIRRKVII